MMEDKWNPHKSLERVLKCISGHEDIFAWHWSRNPRCKYVTVRFDTRDGAFILCDRNGEEITIDQLEYQYARDPAPKNPVDETMASGV